MLTVLMPLVWMSLEAQAEHRPLPVLKLIVNDGKSSRYRCEVTNPSDASWYFLGYAAETIPVPAGRITPVPILQHRQKDVWVAQFDGRCGVGITAVELPARATVFFEVMLHLVPGQEERVGLSIVAVPERGTYRQVFSQTVRGPGK